MSGATRLAGCSGLCGSGGTWGPSKCISDFGPEWDYAGEKSCNYDCKNWYPNTQANCRHARYMGDKGNCCFYGGHAGYSCDPSFINDRFTSSTCEGEFQSRCSVSNIEGDQCRQWAEQDPIAAGDQIKGYCNTRLDSNEWCKGFENRPGAGPLYREMIKSFCNRSTGFGTNICKQWCKSNPGECDTGGTAYCDSNPTADICACLKSPASKYIKNPKCVDETCNRVGYMSKQMYDEACPNVVDCSILLNIKAGGDVNMKDNVMQQDCKLAPGQTGGTTGGGATGGDSTGGDSTTGGGIGSADSLKSKLKNKQFSLLTGQEKGMLGGGIMFFFVMLILMIVLASDDDAPQYPMGMMPPMGYYPPPPPQATQPRFG